MTHYAIWGNVPAVNFINIIEKIYILDNGDNKWPNGDSGKSHLHSGVATLMEYIHFQLEKKKRKKLKKIIKENKKKDQVFRTMHLFCLRVDNLSAWKLHSCEQRQQFLNSDIHL